MTKATPGPQFQIYQRDYDKKWQVCFWVPMGHLFAKHRKTFDTLAEAADWLCQYARRGSI